MSGPGPVIAFAGTYLVANVTTTRAVYSNAYSRTLNPGTYFIGACLLNNSNVPIGNNDYVAGWVQVGS